MNLFIDDERNPIDVEWIEYPFNDWVIVKSYNDAIELIEENGLPENISFDNDLGEQKEGYDIALWVINYCIDNKIEPPKIYIHSQNPIARERIFYLFHNYSCFCAKSVD